MLGYLTLLCSRITLVRFGVCDPVSEPEHLLQVLVERSTLGSDLS